MSSAITVTIDREGAANISVGGIAGKSCVDLTAGLERCLGAKVNSRELNAEYYEDDVEGHVDTSN